MFLRAPTRRILSPIVASSEASVCSLHTTASASAQAQKKRAGFGLKPTESGSRRKLASDLTPRSTGRTTAKIEIAPSDPKSPSSSGRRARAPPRPDFVRDSVPHPDAARTPAARSGGVDGRTLIDDELRPVHRRPDRYIARRAYEERGAGRERFGGGQRLERAREEEERLPWEKPRRPRSTVHEDRAEMQPQPPVVRNRAHNPISAFEVDLEPSERSDLSNLATRFTSPPLLPGLATSCHEALGEEARPTPIQGLAIKHLVAHASDEPRQFLLASETGSGKSIAYLVPLIQALKKTESMASPPKGKYAVEPRALVLAPTHELSRQLSTSAKSLTHIERLRVQCVSRANEANVSTQKRGMSASQMSTAFSNASKGEEFTVTGNEGTKARPVDILVGTPTKVLEMIHGRGWDRQDEVGEDGRKPRRGPPEMGLARVEWVIVDEADVLFDPDFQENTRHLLASISAARGHPVPSTTPSSASPPSPTTYPFNLVLTSATIPTSLASYLDTHHPSMTRLVSPKLHKLPSTLSTEHVPYTGGNRHADIERRLREVWSEDAQRGRPRGKIIVFCNRGTKVEALGEHLAAAGVPNVALSGASAARLHGSNKHLDGFLKTKAAAPAADESVDVEAGKAQKDAPHVLITTSLLSRGLDFGPDVRHVFIADSPRNMIDFLHRAGRSGRAGNDGRVVVFGKLSGRGSEEGREVRQKVRAFAR